MGTGARDSYQPATFSLALPERTTLALARMRSRCRNKKMGSRGLRCRMGFACDCPGFAVTPIGRNSFFRSHGATRNTDDCRGAAAGFGSPADLVPMGAAKVMATPARTRRKASAVAIRLADF